MQFKRDLMLKNKWELFLTLRERDAREEQNLNDLILCVDGVSGWDEWFYGRHGGKLGYHIRDNSINMAVGGSAILDSDGQDTDGD